MPENKQSGQTLVETLVAIFVLTTGLIATITLAIYSFTSVENASKQIVGAGLAREGVEAVKSMRDTNWLTYNLIDDCSTQIAPGQQCYRQWLNGINSSPQNLILNYNTASHKWSLNPGSDYTLYYDTTNHVYSSSNSGVRSVYSRYVRIRYDTTGVFNNQNPMVVATSTVWWTGRRCPATSDPSTLPTSCKVVLEMHLTNWKNY